MIYSFCTEPCFSPKLAKQQKRSTRNFVNKEDKWTQTHGDGERRTRNVDEQFSKFWTEQYILVKQYNIEGVAYDRYLRNRYIDIECIIFNL